MVPAAVDAVEDEEDVEEDHEQAQHDLQIANMEQERERDRAELAKLAELLKNRGLNRDDIFD